jgi:hypothetical protein
LLEELTERLSPEGSASFGLPKNLVRENKSSFHFSIFMDFRINVNYRSFTELACRFVFKPLSLPFLLIRHRPMTRRAHGREEECGEGQGTREVEIMNLLLRRHPDLWVRAKVPVKPSGTSLLRAYD